MVDKIVGKYMWVDRKFDEWCKGQAQMMRSRGFKITTAGVTRIMLGNVLIPNDVRLDNILVTRKPKLKKWKKQY